MIDLSPAEAPAVARRRRWRRGRVGVVLGAALVLVAATTAGLISLHYLHAPGLTTDGGGWAAPDSEHVQAVQAGPYTASITLARPGHPQTFELDLFNPSPVSQTVLGLTHGAELANPQLTAEPEHLSISTTARTYGDNAPAQQFTSKPVVIAPRHEFSLRFTVGTAGEWNCRTESWTELSLQVRVGVFTRTEKLDFGNLLERRGPKSGC